MKGEVDLDNTGQHIANNYAEHPLPSQELHQF